MISTAEKAASLFWRTRVRSLSCQVSASPIWAAVSPYSILKTDSLPVSRASCSARRSFLSFTILRPLPDSRVQYIIKKVCHQIPQNDQHRGEDHRALQKGHIPGLDGIDRQTSDSRHAENTFRQDRAGQHAGNLESHHGHHRKHGVL